MARVSLLSMYLTSNIIYKITKSFISDAPQISYIQNKTKINKDQGPSIIRCDIDRNPVSTVKWFKNGIVMVDTTSDNFQITTDTMISSIFQQKISSELEFLTVDKTDSANYTCEGTNSRGSTEYQTDMVVCCKSSIPLLCLP